MLKEAGLILFSAVIGGTYAVVLGEVTQTYPNRKNNAALGFVAGLASAVCVRYPLAFLT